MTKSPSKESTANKDSETSPKPVFGVFNASMSKEQIARNLIRGLRKSGFKISASVEEKVLQSIEENQW